MKKAVLLSILLCFTVGVLVGCKNHEAGQQISYEQEIADGITVDGKKILTLAYVNRCQYVDEIKQFNESQDEYEIRAVNYRHNDNMRQQESTDLLINEMASGKGPDIIALSGFSIDGSDIENSVYLEDLYPYIDSDSELSRDDFVPSVFKSMEVNGKLYKTCSSFGVTCIVAAKSIADDGTTLDMARVIKAAEDMDGAQKLYCTKIGSAELLREFLMLTIYDFVDVENGTVNFNKQGFYSLLEICSMFENAIHSEEIIIPEGKMDICSINSFSAVSLYASIFGDDAVFVGSFDNRGGLFSTIPGLAMNANSENKEGIWQFLRVFLGEEYQSTIREGFPTNLNALASKQNLAISGKEDAPITPFDSSSIAYETPTDLQTQQVLDLIYRTSINKNERDSELLFSIQEVVVSLAEELFAGTRSIDDTVKTTQLLTQQLMDEYCK